MNSKNIKRHLGNKLRDWIGSIEDENVKAAVKENTIITGGALVSLLTGESVHDYDVYFRTKDACITVAKYYVDKWNAAHEDKPVALMWGEELEKATGSDNGSVKCFVRSKGIADENEMGGDSIAYNFEDRKSVV